ncbi:P-loop containing nucleoside triphosphate hydrolase [Pseudocohnilembus persalinus]|uniref:p-loop containing nucleoside triphosphate hydrolase n=1 Tax=Pseudocohnilembus persalinus TaxID=266149 RepID=A0A0V0QG21_PSEPJ|nr:P-loop containing nucleoside triphosphate hydrolase [Pseudocohnilembus persalinus]|eukprot:KRX01008.1 P-loop containing nucleoside triphosphate hydrolase [Pseudocohnilembus persalinus]
MKPHQIDQDFDWKDSDRLIHNQLVVITNQTFDEDKTFIATVVNRPFSEKSQQHYEKYKRIIARLQLFNKDKARFRNIEHQLHNEELYIYESDTYFDQYRNTLDALKRIDENNFPVGGQGKDPLLYDYNLTNIRYQKYEKYNRQISSDLILKKANVVGFTISGGAKYRDLLNQIQPQVFIIEEAAEVLESQTLSVINKDLKHLILIGDHRQLRPIMQSQEIINNIWSISLFERLITNNIPSSFLGIQKRMRPEIADYIRLVYGEEYQDDQSVKLYENVKGFKSNVQLFSYQADEHKVESRQQYSKTIINKYEAEILANLLLYILQIKQYTMEQVTVLSMYNGQVNELKQQIHTMLQNQMFKSKENEEYYKNYKERIRITSVDSFQGEESEIILLSTIRSNKENIAGFLINENRVNVAFSRARKGLFVIGNFELLYKARQENNIWTKVVDLSKKKGHYQQNHFKFQCQCHKRDYSVCDVNEIQDFIKQIPCQSECGQQLSCGNLY